MKLLAIDTTTPLCSLAIENDDCIFLSKYKTPKTHAHHILPAINALLAEAGLALSELDAIIFSEGPGSFTGIRLAAGLVQGLAYSVGLPVFAVSSLALLAKTAHVKYGAKSILVAVDAYMGEVYLASFSFDNKGVVSTALEDCLIKPASLSLSAADYDLAIGAGWSLYKELEGFSNKISKVDSVIEPDISELISLGKTEISNDNLIDLFKFSPKYLRGKTAWKTLAEQRDRC